MSGNLMKPKITVKPLADEKGMVLVVALLLIAALAVLGTTAVLTSTTDMKISSNYKTNNEAFFIAEAGAERARELLRNDTADGTETPVSELLTDLLEARVGSNGTLSDSDAFTNFYADGAWVSDDVPYISNTNFGSGYYRVYLTNNFNDGVTSTADTDEEVTLTSFGFGPNNSRAVVQIKVRKVTTPDLPGAVVLPGPNVNCAVGSSGAQDVDGGAKPGIAVGTDAALTSVKNGTSKPGNITGNPSGIAKVTMGAPWNSKADILALYQSLKQVATCTGSSCAMGSSASDIVVIDGDAGYTGNDHGYGILVVNGNLTLGGNIDFDGLVLVLGTATLVRNGSGNGTISGSLVVANTNTTDNSLGVPTYTTNGGGNSSIEYNSGALINSLKNSPFVKSAWRQSGM
ncbi:hypothetical membrane protein [Syntrophus aciditrophicus SB]|uniref:Hypothetical membrane protein n=2 Tax=Syntrophus TaxID=43773 RepID=Q2LVV2_SYNAS|nr:hypothetical membrane protein [Syntrophus aciditrophicus SB]